MVANPIAGYCPQPSPKGVSRLIMAKREDIYCDRTKNVLKQIGDVGVLKPIDTTPTANHGTIQPYESNPGRLVVDPDS